MPLQRITAPSLAELSASGYQLDLLEAESFSDDGRLLIVRASFREDNNPLITRYASFIYDVSENRYRESINAAIASALGRSPFEIDVSTVRVAGSAQDLSLIAKYRELGASGESQLALLKFSTSSSPNLLVSTTDVLRDRLNFLEEVPIEVASFALGADARFLAIQTDSEKLSLSDTNGFADVYLIDLQSTSKATPVRVSMIEGAELGDAVALRGIRVDAARITLSLTTPAALSVNDKNQLPQASSLSSNDAYLWSSAYGTGGLIGSPTITLLSLAANRAQGSVIEDAEVPVVVTEKGIFFASSAEGLVAGDTNNSSDLFIYPSSSSPVVQRVEYSGLSSLSLGARLLGASHTGSVAALLTSSPEFGGEAEIQQLVAVNTDSGKWSVISKNDAGLLADDWVTGGVLSPLGDKIAFTALATNLVSTTTDLASYGQLFLANTGVDSVPKYVAPVQLSWWRSGASLKGVVINEVGQAKVLTEGNALIQLKSPRFDGSGVLSIELWAKSTGSLSKVAFDMRVPNDWQLTFALDNQFSTWTKSQSFSGGLLSFQTAGVLTGVSGLVRLGTVSMTLPAAASVAADLLLTNVSVNETAGSAATFSLARGLSDAAGLWNSTGLLADRYTLVPARSTSDLGNNAISSADALAVLKIAVGLSPNPGSAPVTLAQYAAADVDRSNSVNSADALNVLKMAVGLSTAPSKAWLWFDSTLARTSVSSGSQSMAWSEFSSFDLPLSGSGTINLVGVLRGDVDGSWTPPSG